MSSLNIALFAFRYPCFSVHMCSATTLSLCSSSCPLYMGNLIMSPTWQISLVVLSTIQKLPWVISMSCSLFKDLSLHLISILIPNIILYDNYMCLPSLIQFPSHSCDLLKDSLPSPSHHGFSSASPKDKDLEFWWWYLRIQYPYWWTPLLQLLASLI